MEEGRHFSQRYNLAKWVWFYLPSVLLLIPFIRFVKSNAYPVFSPEIFLCMVGIGIGGLLLGLAGRFGRSARALILSGALTLVIDIQSEILFDYSLHQYVWLPLGLWILIFIAPRFVETIFLVTVYLTGIAVLFTPSSPPIIVADFRDVPFGGQGKTRQPTAESIWIHIILDEIIGIESIPLEFDPDHRLAERIKNEYVDNGFTVFGRAFTRFPQTRLSLPNILNLDAQHPAKFLDKLEGKRWALKKSEYLERFRDEGYRIHIYDTHYIQICSLHGDAWTTVCNKIRINSIWSLRGTSLSVKDKTLVILRVYARRSKISTKMVSWLELDKHLSIPRIISPLGAAKVLARFREDIIKMGPGSVWLLYLPLPHYPYALKKNCDIRPWPWLEAGGEILNSPYEWNSKSSRQTKYPLYLEQVECTHQMLQSFFLALKKSGVYDIARIIVHGDHGSRIATHNLTRQKSHRSDFQPSSQTMVDYFGSFFAYKPAGRPTGEYRREMAAVADLLRAVSSGKCCNNIVDEPDPTAYVVEWDTEICRASRFKATEGCRLIPIQMPRFSYGELQDETNLTR